MELALSLAAAVGLSAACGFRIFVPLVVLSGASRLGYVTLSGEMAWLGSEWALIALGGATAVEVLAYFVPWLDNLLDAVASPAAVVAGVLASGAILGELSTTAQWMLATIAGGGTAGLVQAGTVATRGASTATTGGLGNSLVAVLELVGSVVASVLALLAPLAALVLVVGAGVWLGRLWYRRRQSPADSNGHSGGVRAGQ